MATIGLLGAILAGAASVTPASASGERYVALGDSFTAGPLIPNQLTSPAGCLRSDRNYPHVVASQLGLALHDPSCSGAETGDMTSPQGVTPGPNPPQFNSLTSDTDIVTIGIGGNDIGFSSIVKDCVAVFFWVPVCKPKYVANGVDEISNRIAATAPRIASVLQGIHSRSPHARVFVVGYPAILPETGGGCWPSLPLANDDVPWLRDKEKELNTMLAAQAAANGAFYVDTYTPSIGRDACKPVGVRWVEPIIPNGLQAAPVHPNALGEAGMAALVAARITATTPVATTISGTVTDSVSGAPVAGTWVTVLRSTDFSIAAGAVASAAGDFSTPLEAGSYYLYVIDPTGAHSAGFLGAPTTLTVATGDSVDADPTLAPTRGSVSGSLAEDGTNISIGGAWAFALNGSTGAPESGTAANGSGQYSLHDLAPGSHLMVYVDPADSHASEFFANSPDASGAAPVGVSAGGTAVADVSLAAQASTPTGDAISGTVTESGSNNPLSGVVVMALRSADYRMAMASLTDTSGHYDLDLAAGDYLLAFLDPHGGHNMAWHDNQPYFAMANATSVTAPAVANATLARSTGSVSGVVTDGPSGAAIAAAWVVAIGPNGVAGGAATDANGAYTISGMRPGTYRAAIIDPTGAHVLEYWNNSADFAGASSFNVTVGATTTVSVDLVARAAAG